MAAMHSPDYCRLCPIDNFKNRLFLPLMALTSLSDKGHPHNTSTIITVIMQGLPEMSQLLAGPWACPPIGYDAPAKLRLGPQPLLCVYKYIFMCIFTSLYIRNS